MTLTGGAALRVEDLEVTLKCVTYTIPKWETAKYVNRITRNLRKRKIEYILNYRPISNSFPMLSWTMKLVVGGKECLFYTGEYI